MTEETIDLESWPRAETFRYFRGFDRPHYAITTRMDVTRMMAARQRTGLSPFRAALFAIGAGLHGVPELMMRFRGAQVVRHRAVSLSMPVDKPSGGFNYGYVSYDPDFDQFDTEAAAAIARARAAESLDPQGIGDDAVAFMSCLPWIDFTALDNALPSKDDCIPRVAWGKIVETPDGRFETAMAIQVHHALADGAHVGAFFAVVQETLDRF
ncbi:CatA-like O-acetyltransferase [Cognatishimia sp. F0-27]|uniref:CatA-like O-acetyltransferase n=1 Tax=Cognatishimia sp. F0-27 TaxID=2816855 RepID=UPI001D0C1212|nr:CatA-like O-acetyltransferase [Cognatishimia sp. F0-27]MCC1494930.1 chloramphenicol acetyltransferase [Cognatishimia sp. F0-27]